jgi:hypothetical protein
MATNPDNGFGPRLKFEMRRLRIAQGEVENVTDAALRDLGMKAVTHIKNNWPVDTGTTYSKWQVVKSQPNHYVLSCPVPYASYVHIQPQYGGPTPLADRLVQEAFQAFEQDTVAFLSDRVRDLLDPRGPVE